MTAIEDKRLVVLSHADVSHMHGGQLQKETLQKVGARFNRGVPMPKLAARLEQYLDQESEDKTIRQMVNDILVIIQFPRDA